MGDRLSKVDAQLSEIFDELDLRPIVNTVNPTDKLKVVQAGQVGLKGSAEREWPRHVHSAMDVS
jgi:hypothetical protein